MTVLKPLKIIHVSNFNTVHLRSCFLGSMQVKLSHGFTRLGHSVFDWNDRDVAARFGIFGHRNFLSIKKTNEAFIHFCTFIKPDAVVLGHADLLTAETLMEVKKLFPALKILQWNVDTINPNVFSGKHNINNIKSKLEVVDYTLITTADTSLLAQFDPKKHKVGFIPNPVDRSVERARVFENIAPKYDLFFAASPRKIRDVGDKMLSAEELVSMIYENIPEASCCFPQIKEPAVSGADYMEKLSASAMVLNANITNKDYLYSSDRIAHAMGNGCLALVDRESGYRDFFREDEMGFFSTFEEMTDKIRFYREKPQIRMQIAQNGWQKYYDLFNETKVAQYCIDLLTDQFRKENYPFPTID